MALLHLMMAIGFLNNSQAGHNRTTNRLVTTLDKTPHSHKMENDCVNPKGIFAGFIKQTGIHKHISSITDIISSHNYLSKSLYNSVKQSPKLKHTEFQKAVAIAYYWIRIIML